MFFCVFPKQSALGTIIHESATLGDAGSTSGWIVDSAEYLGARFHLDEPVLVTAIGGHIITDQPGTFFGAIITLSGPDALPLDVYSPLLSPSEVIASVVFNPDFTIDVRVPLSVTLVPGDYALIFGTDQFGASGGFGIMPFEGKVSLPGASYFCWVDDGFGGVWFDDPGIERFVVEGEVIPEPATLLLLGLGGLFLRRRK